MSDNVITLSLNPSRLTTKGKKAFELLLTECMGASNVPGPISSAPDKRTVTRSFYKYVSRHDSQKGIVDFILNDAVATYKEIKKAAGHPNGGAPMAGVLSSVTRNWQRASGDKTSKGVILWDDYKERYFIVPEMVADLREAKAFFNTPIPATR